MKRNEPGPVWQAIRLLAKAVRMTSELEECPEPRIHYYVTEYLTDMEEMLLDQLYSVTDDQLVRETFLEGAGLDYLVLRMREKAEL